MRWSSRLPGFAICLAGLLLVAPAMAQESPDDLQVNPSKGVRKVFQSLRDFAGYGAYLGGMKVFGGDLGGNAQPKPLLEGVFRYHFSDRWVGVGEFGFGWNSFRDRGDTVLTVTRGTLGAARKITRFFNSDIRLGLGGGFYRWNYKYHGKSLRDNQTYRYYRGIAPGGYLGLEGERRVTSHITVLLSLQQNYMLTSDSSKFKSLFDVNYPFLGAQVGVTYHFSPYEGILWERKENRKIRLESGKEGK